MPLSCEEVVATFLENETFHEFLGEENPLPETRVCLQYPTCGRLKGDSR